MKKVFVVAACVVLAAAAIGCAKKAKNAKEEKTSATKSDESEVEATELEDLENPDEKDAYPQIVYIDNVLYYGTGEECEQVPRKMPEGIIETFCAKEIMPDAPNSANFGEENEKMEYMFLDEGQLIIHNGEKWFYFEKENEE